MPVELRKVETIHQGYSTLMLATLAAPDGSTFTREIEHHGRAAAVLPYDPERRCALMVNLPRPPVIWAGGPPELLEAPAGMVENEDAEETATREALEEAGVKLGRLEAVGSPFSSPGVSSERIDLFLAAYSTADRVGDGGGLAEEQEHITVEEVPLAQLWTWVEQRRIEDLKTLALILALKVRRPELFEP
ncbi:pyrophosphohydrolase including oxidative damage repair enzymes [Phenylobacterium zucineum HLK1]|uniref:GDP-mannose pyrophosphatase n=1 Tax=Phenylobacterium zucineum (strain HLK1) TaxID=450851 RepID=B4RAN7_PHEZH|nr:NUDIX hydrolase [Phenylobacterium zucineum]ACG79635.1 pyrophosphohydrolase including oxidative damage repair enzymes [Phenylobacterium zucineum HLK1]